MSRHKILNSPAIRRMPVYYHRMMLLQQRGREHVSTSELAEYMSLDPIVVRKDFELAGAAGDRGVGYRISAAIEAIREFLGWNRWTRACLVGAGSLGTALLGFHEFTEYGLNIASVFDASPKLIGKEIYGRIVCDVQTMAETVVREKIEMAILCVPGHSAQGIADELVGCGVKLLWNFSNVCLQVPDDVIVQREVIAGGFAMLSRKNIEHCPRTPID